MAIPASSPCVLYREFYHREQQTSPSSSAAATCGAWLPVTPGCSSSGIFSLVGREIGWRRRRRAADVRAGPFWISKPTSVEMEEITTMEEMDEALRRSQELSELLIIDWMASWCRKCIYLKPKLEKLAAEFHPRIKFYFVDVNKVPQALVKRANISLWKDGEWKAEIIGGHKAWLVIDEVREMIQNNT